MSGGHGGSFVIKDDGGSLSPLVVAGGAAGYNGQYNQNRHYGGMQNAKFNLRETSENDRTVITNKAYDAAGYISTESLKAQSFKDGLNGGRNG